MNDSVERARRHGAGDLLRRTAARTPDKVALVADGGDRHSPSTTTRSTGCAPH